MRFIPLGNRVVVSIPRAEAKSRGGILLPQTAVQQNAGTVVAVGPGAPSGRDGKVAKPPVKIGHVIRFLNATDDLGGGFLVVESSAIVGRWEKD